MCQALPRFYSDYNSKSLFISVSNNFYEKYIVTQDYCVSTHDSFCSLGNCKFHIILIGTSLSQILQRLDKYQYIYQEIDCLYTLYKHRFFPSIVTSSGEVFNQLSCGVFLARMDIPNQVWHMVEVMRRDFSEHHITQVPPYREST